MFLQNLNQQSENIRINVILDPSQQKFVVVTKWSKTVKEFMDQLQEDILEFLKQTETIGKMAKKIVKVNFISSKGFQVLQNYKIEDIFQNSEIINVNFELQEKVKKIESQKNDDTKSVKQNQTKEKIQLTSKTEEKKPVQIKEENLKSQTEQKISSVKLPVKKQEPIEKNKKIAKEKDAIKINTPERIKSPTLKSQSQSSDSSDQSDVSSSSY